MIGPEVLTMTDRAKYWARMVAAWEASGLTQAEFCRRRGLKAVTFAWWKRQLVGWTRGGGRGRRNRGGRQVSAGSSNPSFVEVALPDGAGRSVKPAGAAGTREVGYEVAFPCGTSIRLPADFDVDKASQLIQAARSC
jgi:hypothetical protein